MNKIIDLKQLPNQSQRERSSRTRESAREIERSPEREVGRTRVEQEPMARPQELRTPDTITVKEPRPEGRPVIQDPLTGGEIAE